MDNILKLSEDGKTIIGVNNKSITHITIPEGVTTIEKWAFSGCKALQSINIPNCVTTIGDFAFSGCSELKSIDIPNSVTKIGNDAFRNCSALQCIDIPNSVTKIGEDAFSHCSALQSINVSDDNPNYTSVDGILFNKELSTIIKLPEGGKIEVYNIPKSITAIEKSAFWGCSALESIDIPCSVTAIENYAFMRCSALQSINVSDDNPNYTSVDGILFNKQLSTIIKFPQRGNIEVYNIPSCVTTIGDLAFYGCSSLQSIDIPNSVTTIGNSAFTGCLALQRIDIPNSITIIESSTFSHCSTLQSIDIPNSVTTIGEDAFRDCSSLQSIDIPNSVTTIGYNAFRNCSALQSIDIPNSVTIIGDGTFWGCSSLKSIHLHWTKLDCIQINKYTFDENNKVNFEECTLYVPPGTRWEYRHHPVFDQFKNIIAKTKCTTFQNETYNFLVFSHPTKKQLKRHLITVSTVIKCLFTTLSPTLYL